MHIETNSDKIFSNGSWEREVELRDLLNDKFPNDLVELVDAVWPHDEENAKRVISDTVFLYNTKAETVPLHPELWGYLYPFTDPISSTHVPSKRLNCLLNRISGERLHLFFELARRDLVENNYVNFNCLVKKDPSLAKRKQYFIDLFTEVNWPGYQFEFNDWVDRMPLFLETTNIDWVMLDSEVTIISETYMSEFTIAFSEKIFRALQTPRPWLLNCSPGSVALLRDHGFDVLDDVVNHKSYDHLYNGRIDAMLDELDNITFNLERCQRAATHNYNRLQELNMLWPEKLNRLITTHAS